MFGRKRIGKALAGSIVLCLGLAGPASADVIYNFNTPGGNANQQGLATFDFSTANTFTLTLQNTGTIVDISSVLDGFTFTESGTVITISLTAISANASVDCTTSTNKTSTCTETPGGAPVTDWGVTNSSSNISLTAGAAAALKPYGIVNDSIDTNGNLDGLRNGEHNPFLEGPVVFSLTTTGETVIPTISNVDFLFGTVPAVIPGSPGGGGGQPPGGFVPEPSGLLLLSTGLLALGWMMRRRAA